MGRERIIERERRWAVPAAVAALFALVFYIASFIIDQSANLSTGASEAAQLRSLDAHSGTVLFAWRWPRAATHTLTLEPGVPNAKEGGSFLHLSGYEVLHTH